MNLEFGVCEWWENFFGKVLISVFIFGEEATPYNFNNLFKLFLSQEKLNEFGAVE